MHVLAIEPYFGGSHRAFLDSVVRRSRHRWTLLTGTPRHWKWRMRNAPLALARQLRGQLASAENRLDEPFDLVFCSDMLDLAQWRGLLCQGLPLDERGSDSLAVTNSSGTHSSGPESSGLDWAASRMRIATLPAITYFHENQWTYPESPRARHDAHYGYTNLLTALGSDEVWFNSEFHRRDFLRASRDFVARMPDETKTHNLDGLASRCAVVPPGFEPVPTRDDLRDQAVECQGRPIVIGWASRWEYDKRPDRFEQLLKQLTDRGLDFELVLLGPRPVKPPASLLSIEQRYASNIRFSGFVADRTAYEARLREMDIVVSTADHEFFGIAICEAISAGAIPLLPDGLSYPELVDVEFLYDSLPEAADKLVAWSRHGDPGGISSACRRRIEPLMIGEVIEHIDRGIVRVASARGTSINETA